MPGQPADREVAVNNGATSWACYSFFPHLYKVGRVADSSFAMTNDACCISFDTAFLEMQGRFCHQATRPFLSSALSISA